LDLNTALKYRDYELEHLDEYRLDAIKRQALAKAQTKKFHDSKIVGKEFKAGDYALLYNMRLHKHPAKLEYKWKGPFQVLEAHPNGSLLLQSGGHPFKVNDHRCKNAILGLMILVIVNILVLLIFLSI